MPQVDITIGGRTFEVACETGEEPYLHAAAATLDAEAAHLSAQIGRMTEARMLLMAGLMLADRTAGLEDQLRRAAQDIASLQAALNAADQRVPQRVEVPVMPAGLQDTLADIAQRAEGLADQLEGRS
ncbi:cell division protein ZapA [Loktanella fryxellensis]|uniref:Cell division protein ZapA n=1 Tax=Loktanella fryxellensis TaxID=245187 RepID=A0A1H7YN95_9RHOB|nr:cell division protein ZapA [Loktanella fryxellensis]SEM47411.1 cell division protein ZapA [Loktanella fryxellensis]